MARVANASCDDQPPSIPYLSLKVDCGGCQAYGFEGLNSILNKDLIYTALI